MERCDWVAQPAISMTAKAAISIQTVWRSVEADIEVPLSNLLEIIYRTQVQNASEFIQRSAGFVDKLRIRKIIYGQAIAIMSVHPLDELCMTRIIDERMRVHGRLLGRRENHAQP